MNTHESGTGTEGSESTDVSEGSGAESSDIRVTSAFPPRDTAVGGYLEPIRAGGAVLWRDAGRSREVVLIRRPDRGDWTLPKGKLKNGEHPIIGAVREVEEETGLTPVMGRRLPPQRYLKEGWPKQVEWWAATPAQPGAGIDYEPNDEVELVEWVPVEEARYMLGANAARVYNFDPDALAPVEERIRGMGDFLRAEHLRSRPAHPEKPGQVHRRCAAGVHRRRRDRERPGLRELGPDR